MTSKEIRDKYPRPSWADGKKYGEAVPYDILDVLVEIAAQLAEMNERLAKI